MVVKLLSAYVLKNEKILIKLAVIMLFNSIILNSLYLLYNPGINDSFVLERLGMLTSHFETNPNLIMKGFETIPNSPYYILTIHLITGYDIINTGFIPIIPLISILPIYLFAKIFFDDKYSLFVSAAVYFYVFGRASHYSEYVIAQLMFLCFIYSFYRYFYTYNPRFFLLLILFYSSVKFFGPPMEIWITTFVFLIVVISYLLKKANFANISGPNFNTLALFIVLLLVYNPKFYEQFLIRDSDLLSVFSNFYNFLVSMIIPSSYGEAFTVIPAGPFLSKYTKISYLFLGIAPIFAKIFYDIKSKNISDWINNRKTFYCIILVLVFVADLSLYGSIGLIDLRYVVLIFPIIGAYFFRKMPFCSKNVFSVYLLILILLSVLCNAFTIQYERYPFSKDHLYTEVTWIADNTRDNSEFLTDHYTYANMFAISSEIYHDYRFKTLQYSSKRYLGIIDSSKNYPLDFNYLILDSESLNLPIRKGPPSWTYFEPLNEKYTLLNNNSKMDKVYNSQEFQIYSAI